MHHILKIYLLITILGISHASIAEVVLDGTLGSSGALAGPNFAIEANLGQQMGNNLFHSFETFNINQHESATFSGPETINNIISRVTGGKTSNINGLLASTIPDADMYLINPAGIIFGEHANLDIQGSFHASTANYLRLGKNGRFNASHPKNSLLTVAPPSAFGFLDESPAGIKIYGSLTIGNEKAISLIGGDLTLQDNHLIARSGQVNLVSVASSGEVQLDPENLSDNVFEQFGTIIIRNTLLNSDNLNKNANINVSGEGGGRVYIQGGQILMENVRIFANTIGAKNGQGIIVKATDKFVAKGLTKIMTKALRKSFGNGGNINIDAREIKLTDDSYIITNSEGSGSAGDITITATENINITGFSNKLGGGLLANTVGTGKGGNINITASTVTLDASAIHALTGGSGHAGKISLEVNTLTIKRGASVSVKTVGTGDGGTLTVTAKEAVLITGQLREGKPSSLKSETASGRKDIDSPGNGGSIIVSTPLLELDQGIITASSSGTGNAGNIKITSPGYLHLSNSEITTSVSANNGNGGNITLDPEFIILDNSYIKANAFEGKGGNINITSTDIYNFSGEPVEDMITAISVNGLDGLVTINSPDIDISQSLTQILPKTFLDAASLLKNKQCARRSRLNLSNLSIIRGDVVPKDPMDLRNHSMQLAAPGFKPCHVSNGIQLQPQPLAYI